MKMALKYRVAPQIICRALPFCIVIVECGRRVFVVSMEDPPVFAPLGSPGSSTYSKSIPVTTWMIEAATPSVLKAIADIPYSPDVPFTICDYGTADGGASIPILNACIDAVRSLHGKQTDILILYNDLPTNDFVSVIKNAIVADNVYTNMVAKSFYNQICPSGTVHLGISVAAAHWLSCRPCDSNGPIVHLLHDDEIVSCYREQAVKDWETFLLHRTKELVPGGHLMTCVVVDDLDGSQPFCPLWKAMNQVWEDMWHDNRINQDEYMGTSSGVFHSTTADKLAPFADIYSAISRAGLRLVKAENKNTTTGFQRFVAESEKDSGTERQALGRGVTGIAWGIFHAAFENTLSSSRQQIDRDAIISEVRKRLTDIVAKNPGTYINMDCRAAYILMTRV